MSMALIPAIKAGIPATLKTIQNWGLKNAPSLLSAAGCVGVGASIVMGVKVTPEAIEAIEDALMDKWESTGSKLTYIDWLDEQLNIDDPLRNITLQDKMSLLTKREIIEACWKLYIPTAATALTTMFCITGSNAINLKRQAALSSLLALTQTNFDAFKEKAKEMLGEKKASEIKDAVMTEMVNNNPPNRNVIIDTGKGTTLCYEPLSGRYFYSDIEAIKKIEPVLQTLMLEDGRVSVNDMYWQLGLGEVKLGNDQGWMYEDRMGLFRFDFSSCLMDDEKPCLVVGTRSLPRDI